MPTRASKRELTTEQKVNRMEGEEDTDSASDLDIADVVRKDLQGNVDLSQYIDGKFKPPNLRGGLTEVLTFAKQLRVARVQPPPL